jgi:hypothetical protein
MNASAAVDQSATLAAPRRRMLQKLSALRDHPLH